jgi:streptomycin 6-kinase
MSAPHPGLAWAEETDAGRAWLARLPGLLRECVEQWSLELGEPFPYAYVSLALAARGPSGEDAVLKISFPHGESAHEGDALERWNGAGAVRLLAQDRLRRALLIERCRPGTPLQEMEHHEALSVMIGLLPRLWLPAGAPFRSLADEAAQWIESIPRHWEAFNRPFERKLVDAAVTLLAELAASQGDQVLLHQDLHAENVLRAEREPWLVIDPKPLAGEREFSPASVIRGLKLGHSERGVRRSLDRLSAELGLDSERVRGWALGQTIAWAFDPEYHAGHVETARWLLNA